MDNGRIVNARMCLARGDGAVGESRRNAKGGQFLGTADSITKAYMRDNAHAADIFNLLLYGGEQRIQPEQLTDIDTTEIALPYGDGTAMEPEQKYRDVLKNMLIKADGNTAYCILGIENQTQIHYAMPVRVGLYDFIHLQRQVQAAASAHSQAGKTRTDKEFLSGFRRDDKLLPVVTLVLYFGADEWDGPRSVAEMYSVQDENILTHAVDYKLNLITPYALREDEIDKLQTDLREVIQFIKFSRDKNKLKQIVNNNTKFQSMERQSAELLKVVTGKKLAYVEKEGTINMRNALDEIKDEGRAEGMEKGIQKGRTETLRSAIIALMDNGKRSAEEAMQMLKIPAKDYPKYMAML